jgi:hypothetical protein
MNDLKATNRKPTSLTRRHSSETTRPLELKLHWARSYRSQIEAWHQRWALSDEQRHGCEGELKKADDWEAHARAQLEALEGD